MPQGSGYTYFVRMQQTSISTSKTLIQIKAGAAALEIIEVYIHQITKIVSEMNFIYAIQWTGTPTAGTVTAFTPVGLNPANPASLAISGTAATGVNATAEPSGGTQNFIEYGWNMLNGELRVLDIPEGRLIIPQGKLFTLKLGLAPSSAITLGCFVKFIEYQ